MTVRLKRVRSEDRDVSESVVPGTMIDDGLIACREGAIRLLEVQPPDKGVMSWEAFQRGRNLPIGTVFSPIADRES